MNVYLTGKNADGTNLTDAEGNSAGRVLVTNGEDFTDPAFTFVNDQSLQTVAQFDTGQYSILTVQMIPGGTTLDQCEVLYRNAAGSTPEIYFNTATDWTSPDGTIMIDSNGVDATTLAADAICSFRIDVMGHGAVLIKAAENAATGGTLSITARGE